MHVAIIMNGNGRWAMNRGLLSTARRALGHGALDELAKSPMCPAVVTAS